ncbi:MAG TPA: hypothetical protein VFP45_03400 [Candidatus Nitrosotalea sp.]|nr:hypothetical protein [Candidatus Nitrosotalea sp.]
MNYQQQDTISKAIVNKNDETSTISVILIAGNEKPLYLPPCLYDIIGFRVRSLSWTNTPESFATGSSLQLASQELTENCLNQSSFLIPDSVNPNSAQANRFPIIATWEFKKGVASPNDLYLRRDKQPIIWLQRPSYFNRLSFKVFIDRSFEDVNFDLSNGVAVTIEFFYHVKTSK